VTRLPRLRLQGDLARNLAGSVFILAVVTLALAVGALRPLDDVFNGWRFRTVERPASQTLAVVEIDSRSLARAGVWPWDRERYAVAIDRLIGAGATLVAFDVDFSAASNPASDAALAEAVARHPGQVTLGAFRQWSSHGGADREVVENLPLPGLRREALIASVNVPVDADGEVRRYGLTGPDRQRPSLAANLAGREGAGDFAIDYGVDRRSIPFLSFDDVLTGRFDPALVEGRVVLVGATALELGDEFATPVGLLPGVTIHALAYESMVGGRMLATLSTPALLALCLGLGLLVLPRRDGRHLGRLGRRHALIAGALVAGSVGLQAAAPVSLDIAAPLLTQGLFGLWAVLAELERRKQAIVEAREAALRHQTLHHTETGLPNRRALIRHIETARSKGAPVLVVAVGVERHAEMRGAIGYQATNLVIRELARRLAEVSGSDCLAHLSSSVLALSRAGLTAAEGADLLERLQLMGAHFQVEGHAIDVFVRLGAVEDRNGELSAATLVERATLALDRARASTQPLCILDPAALDGADTNLAMMTELREGLTRGDVDLHYQPKLTLADGRIASVEALCRWRHPVRGAVPPDRFIPVAEETGQIRILTEWALARAIADLARLRARGHELSIALNVSGRLLGDAAFRDRVLQLTAAADAAAGLCLEITETAVIDDPRKAVEAIAAFRAAGLKVSIDDYGSGLSSLAYLKMINADELKLDRSLVSDLTRNQRDRLIMKSTIDLAHGLGMSVVAEGVEDEATLACLSLLGCDTIQGYWLSRPLPLPDLLAFLETRQPAAAPAPRRIAV
jgi:EAL domain-containing protein (putative c-di-GMP-specific phosphodiesterase class I)/CHASE2 domain-containing sensor protein/GGDEF domain-containing protein